MAIAPITGKLRKRLWLDVTMALGLGTSAAYAWWYVFNEPFTRVEPVADRVRAGTATTSLPVSLSPTLLPLHAPELVY